MKAGECQKPTGTFWTTFRSFENNVMDQHTRLIFGIETGIRESSQNVLDLAGQNEMGVGSGTSSPRFQNKVPIGVQLRKMIDNTW
jgi:uncharacterized protein YigE (DUF2233 family)